MVSFTSIRTLIKYLPIGLEYETQIRKPRQAGDDNRAKETEEERDRYLFTLFEQREVSYTDKLVRKARHLRVPVPPKQRWNEKSDEYEFNAEWWFAGPEGD
jgi:hypothetical protein